MTTSPECDCAGTLETDKSEQKSTANTAKALRTVKYDINLKVSFAAMAGYGGPGPVFDARMIPVVGQRTHPGE